MMTGPRTTLLAGAWLAWGLAVLYAVYIATLFAGGVASGVPVEPYLAAAEVLTALSGVLQVALFATVFRCAPDEARLSALMALLWMVVMAALTITVHVVQLTAGRQIDPAAMPDYRFIFGWTWPSLLYAIELVAWHLFFGLALLFAAPAFGGSGPAIAARTGLLAAGALCLVGLARSGRRQSQLADDRRGRLRAGLSARLRRYRGGVQPRGRCPTCGGLTGHAGRCPRGRSRQRNRINCSWRLGRSSSRCSGAGSWEAAYAGRACESRRCRRSAR